MSKKKEIIWLVILIIILLANIGMYFFSNCNTTLNYVSSIVAAFSLGLWAEGMIR